MIDDPFFQSILWAVLAYLAFNETKPHDHWSTRIPLQVIGLCMAGMSACNLLIAFRVGM